MLRNIDKCDTNLNPHNMVMSKYEGKTSKTLGVIQVEVIVGTTSTPALSVVIPTKANYNLLLDWDQIHGLGHSIQLCISESPSRNLMELSNL